MSTREIKLLVMIPIFLVIFTGCYNSDWYMENPDKDAKLEMEKVLETNDFDTEKWEYIAHGTYGHILIDGPEIQNISWHYKDYRGKYLDLDYSGLSSINGDFTPVAISEFYYADYILNNYIFDSEYGNNLKDFFIMQDNLGINYYVSNTNSSGITSIDSVGNGRASETYACLTPYTSDEKIDVIEKYIGNSKLEDIDWVPLIDELNCQIVINIYYDEENLNEVGITLEEIEDEVVKYYNEEYINIELELFDWNNEDKLYSIMDSNYIDDGKRNTFVSSREELLSYNYDYQCTKIIAEYCESN